MRQRKQHPNKEARRENVAARRIAMMYGIPVKSIGLWPNKGDNAYFELCYVTSTMTAHCRDVGRRFGTLAAKVGRCELLGL
jgi:hypothetical protein